MQLARSPRREGRRPSRRRSFLAATAVAVVLSAPQAAAAMATSATEMTSVSGPAGEAPAKTGAAAPADVAAETGETGEPGEIVDATAVAEPEGASPADPDDDAAAPDEDPDADAAAPDDELDAEGPDDDTETVEEEDAADDEPASETPEPPRVDGIYVGLTGYVPLTFARVRTLETDGVFVGPGGSFRAGEAVYPWMTIGIEITGELAYRTEQRVGQGALLVDVGFLPIPKRNLSLHVGFGIGGGAVRQDGIEGRKGYGGAAFKATARYEFFPFAKRKRPLRGGGFSLGPELGWFGLTPAKRGRPMSNTVYFGLTTTYYFGA